MYIMLFDLDIEWGWSEEEIQVVIDRWEGGQSIKETAKEIDRDVREVFLLCVDLAFRGLIEKRKGGVFGG